MKITTGLRVTIITLISFSILSAGSVFYQLNRMTEDGNVVNYSGRQRAISQRLTKMVYAKQRGDYSGEEIPSLISQLDKIVNGLLNGDPSINLPPAANEKAIAKMKEMMEAWEEFKDTINRTSKDASFMKELFEDSERILKIADEATTTFAASSEKKVRALKTIQIVLLTLNILILAGLWFLSQRKIARPLYKLAEEVSKISEGNLKVDLVCGSKGDEINALSKSMETMVTSLKKMINNIIRASESVIAVTEVLQSRADTVSRGAKGQSSQAHQIATAAEEMSQTITEIAKNASIATETSEEAMRAAEVGKEIADGAVNTVNKVYNSTVNLATMVERLNKRSEEIGDIVSVIKDIADQTNLLALNAAIEAARAGEQGRGFAVVADEVRKLAERTIKATVEVSEKIAAIQTDSIETANSMTEASSEVTQATDFIKKVGESLNQIVFSVQRVKDQITNIATAVDEQSAASEEVARNIEKTSAIAKEMEIMAEDVMKEVSNLTATVEGLRNSVTGFNLD